MNCIVRTPEIDGIIWVDIHLDTDEATHREMLASLQIGSNVTLENAPGQFADLAVCVEEVRDTGEVIGMGSNGQRYGIYTHT